jgi:LCP family protein required for cell wall assembly
MSDNNEKRKRPKLRITLIVLASIFTVCILAAVVYASVMLGRIDYTGDEEPTIFAEDAITPEPEDEPDDGATIDPAATPDPAENQKPGFNEKAPYDKEILNVLLIGMDRRSPNENGRSDTMIIATFDKKHKKLKMTSIMRDTYVSIPGNYKNNRINASFAYGNAPLLIKTINTNFNLNIEKYIAVDFEMFQQVVKRIGNLDIELTDKEAGKLMGEGTKGGMYDLDPEMALSYARLRKIDSDFSRTNRQRNLLTAIYKKGIKTDVFTLSNMLYDVLPHVKTNLTKLELLGFTSEVFNMGKSDIEELRIPYDGTYRSAKIRGMAVLVPELDKNATKIKDFIYGK